MIRNILVLLDGSARAEGVLPRASAVAQAFGARVELLHVLQDPGSQGGEALPDPLRSRLLRAEKFRYLEETAVPLREAGIRARSRVEEGPVAEVIVEILARGDHTLVALTPHGSGNSPFLRLGSTALTVIMNTPTSVLLVPEPVPGEGRRKERGGSPGPILAPVDCSPRSDWALSAAAALAVGSGGTLRIVHVLRPPEILERLPGGSEVEEVVQTLLRKNRREANRYLDDIARRLAREGLTIRCEVIEAPRGTASTLQELATTAGAELVVMSAHGHGASLEWPFGGIASKLMLWARLPILLLQDLPCRRPPSRSIESSSRPLPPASH